MKYFRAELAIDQDRQERRQAARHDGVDRDLFDSDRRVARREFGDDRIRGKAAAGEHAIDERPRRRHDRQAVGPAALVTDLDLRGGVDGYARFALVHAAH